MAISGLSSEDQAKLVRDLPALLTGQEGELAWQRILRDPTPSPALSSLGDAMDAEYHRNPEAFPEINDTKRVLGKLVRRKGRLMLDVQGEITAEAIAKAVREERDSRA